MYTSFNTKKPVAFFITKKKKYIGLPVNCYSHQCENRGWDGHPLNQVTHGAGHLVKWPTCVWKGQLKQQLWQDTHMTFTISQVRLQIGDLGIDYDKFSPDIKLSIKVVGTQNTPTSRSLMAKFKMNRFVTERMLRLRSTTRQTSPLPPTHRRRTRMYDTM